MTAAPPAHVLLVLGDSKAAPDSNHWPQLLAAELSTTESPWRALVLGRGGYTVGKTHRNLCFNNDRATFRAAILPSAELFCDTSTSYLDRCEASLHGVAPDIVFLNLGTNDVGFEPPWVLPGETAWKNTYLSSIDMLHSQWPSAQIYITKPCKVQRGGDDRVFDTMAVWIDEIIASRSSFVHCGDDERVWLRPHAATLTSDGIHPNAAGQIAAKEARLRIVIARYRSARR